MKHPQPPHAGFGHIRPFAAAGTLDAPLCTDKLPLCIAWPTPLYRALRLCPRRHCPSCCRGQFHSMGSHRDNRIRQAGTMRLQFGGLWPDPSTPAPSALAFSVGNDKACGDLIASIPSCIGYGICEGDSPAKSHQSALIVYPPLGFSTAVNIKDSIDWSSGFRFAKFLMAPAATPPTALAISSKTYPGSCPASLQLL